MEPFIVVIVVLFLLLVILASKSKTGGKSILKTEIPGPNSFSINPHDNAPIRHLTSVSTVSEGNGYQNEKDVIDVSNESFTLPHIQAHVPYPGHIPFYPFNYVYSADELENADEDQQIFFTEFKKAFIKGICYDVNGYTSYYFLLMFDLLRDYDNKKIELARLEQLMDQMVTSYPRTRQYARNELLRRMEAVQDEKGVERILYDKKVYQDPFATEQLGDKYRKKLNLTATQVFQLNALIDTSNKFNTIEYCAIQLIRMFFQVKDKLQRDIENSNGALQNKIDVIADLEIRNTYHYNPGTSVHNDLKLNFRNTIHQLIFKCCENKLREHLHIGRKTEFIWYLRSEQANQAFKNDLLPLIESGVEEAVLLIRDPEHEADMQLNEYGKTRWKQQIEQLESGFDPTKKDAYISGIYKLGKANQQNPAIENIFFRASKFIASHDKLGSLRFYVHYLYYDLKSPKIDNKQLTKTIQKSLFTSKEQLNDFEMIVSELMHNKNLEKALHSVETIYHPKKKKIKLSIEEIEKVRNKDAATVSKLEGYLQDGYEDERTTITAQEIGSTELELTITSRSEGSAVVLESPFGLLPIHMELLQLFVKNDLDVPHIELEKFCKSRSAFMNQLIQGINELLFDHLDDILIEEDEDSYSINELYYNKIFQK